MYSLGDKPILVKYVTYAVRRPAPVELQLRNMPVTVKIDTFGTFEME